MGTGRNPIADARPPSELRGKFGFVLAAALCQAWGNTHVYALGSLMVPLGADFGWSRGEVSASLFIGAVVATLAAPFAGAWIDRRGFKAATRIFIPYYFAVFALLSLVSEEIFSWYLVWGLLTVIQTPMSTSLWAAAVARQFDRSRGVALAITLSGSAAMSAFAPLVLTQGAEHFGWRGAIAFLAALGLVISVITSRLLVKRDAEATAAAAEKLAAAPGVSLRDATRSMAFWLFGCALFVVGGVTILMIVHLQPMLIDSGLEPQTAARFAALTALTILIGRLGIGFCFDHLKTSWVIAMCFALPALTCLCAANIAHIPNRELVLPLLAGLCMGLEGDMVAYLTAKYFGMRHYNSIYSVLGSIYGLGAGTMTMLAGIAYDAFGSYQTLMFVLVGLLALSYLLTLWLPRLSPVQSSTPAEATP